MLGKLPLLILTLAYSVFATTAVASVEQLEWIRQFGTDRGDSAHGVTIDGLDGVYLAGGTNGSFVGMNSGLEDVFLAKYTNEGVPIWITQFGTSSGDVALDVVTDDQGGVYVSGYTSGSLCGTNFGSHDAWLAKYDSNGSVIWKRQLGTAQSDFGDRLAFDGHDSVYLAGSTFGSLAGTNFGSQDGFVARYDTDGTHTWAVQFGTEKQEEVEDIVADGVGNVYVSGYTVGAFGGDLAGFTDAFLVKIDASGQLLWKTQLGTTGNDRGRGIAVDAQGDIYLAGETTGALDGENSGGNDGFLAKFSSEGKLTWAVQFGTSAEDRVEEAHGDAMGNIFVVGSTDGSLMGTSVGDSDVFLAKFNASGAISWATQFGTTEFDGATDVIADHQGMVYLAGVTTGSLGATNIGYGDAFLAKINPMPVPEPSTSAFLLVMVACVLSWMCHRNK